MITKHNIWPKPAHLHYSGPRARKALSTMVGCPCHDERVSLKSPGLAPEGYNPKAHTPPLAVIRGASAAARRRPPAAMKRHVCMTDRAHTDKSRQPPDCHRLRLPPVCHQPALALLKLTHRCPDARLSHTLWVPGGKWVMRGSQTALPSPALT